VTVGVGVGVGVGAEMSSQVSVEISVVILTAEENHNGVRGRVVGHAGAFARGGDWAVETVSRGSNLIHNHVVFCLYRRFHLQREPLLQARIESGRSGYTKRGCTAGACRVHVVPS